MPNGKDVSSIPTMFRLLKHFYGEWTTILTHRGG